MPLLVLTVQIDPFAKEQTQTREILDKLFYSIVPILSQDFQADSLNFKTEELPTTKRLPVQPEQ